MSRFYFENVERETNIENILEGFSSEDERFTKLTIESKVCVRDLKVLFSQYKKQTQTMEKEMKELERTLENLKSFNEKNFTEREKKMNELDNKIEQMEIEEKLLLEQILNQEKLVEISDGNLNEISLKNEQIMRKIDFVDFTFNNFFFRIKDCVNQSNHFFRMNDILKIVRKVRHVLIPIEMPIGKNDIAKIDGILMGCNSENKINWDSLNIGKKKIKNKK